MLVQIVKAPSNRVRTVCLLKGEQPPKSHTYFSSTEVPGLHDKLLEIVGPPPSKKVLSEDLSQQLCEHVRVTIGSVIHALEQQSNDEPVDYQQVSLEYQNFIVGLVQAEDALVDEDNEVFISLTQPTI